MKQAFVEAGRGHVLNLFVATAQTTAVAQGCRISRPSATRCDKRKRPGRDRSDLPRSVSTPLPVHPWSELETNSMRSV
jgi:hypothetical protein